MSAGTLPGIEKPFTEEQATAFFAWVFGGKHHIPGKLKKYGLGWAVCCARDLATWDQDYLTRLVFAAHDACIRLAIEGASPQYVRICIWKRKGREGSVYARHPALMSAVIKWRIHNPLPDGELDDENPQPRGA